MARRDAEEYDPLLQENGHLTRLAVSITSSNLALASNGSAAPNSSLASKNDQAVGQALLAELQDIKSDNILRAQGHEATMRRSFSPLAALALGFSITNSWVGYLSCFGQNLKYAGPHSVIFGLLVAAVIQWTISLGLSEIASCFPSSGGQYHFVFILAPKRQKKLAAFVVGWMNLLGWSIALCSGLSTVVASVSGMMALWNDAFQATQWQMYVIYVVTAILSALPLFLGPRLMPKILQASLAFSIIGFLIIFFLVLTLRKHTQPASLITTPRVGTSGWGLETAWILGIGNSMYTFAGTDAVIHIAEEMSSPERKLPLVINLTMTIGFMTVFPLLLAMMFGMTDVDAVANSQLPYGELFYQITESKVITTAIMSWITIVYFSALIGQWVTCGRLAWAFARDRGLPYSNYFSHISEKHGFPLRTTVLSLCFCSTYGLLYLISTTAFNSIITSAVLYLNITYAIPQALIVARGRQNVLPQHAFNLGRVGYVCNVLSPLLVLWIGTLICFPPELPVTSRNFNYTPVVLLALFLAILSVWFTAGKRFEGPQIDWEVLSNIKIT